MENKKDLLGDLNNLDKADEQDLDSQGNEESVKQDENSHTQDDYEQKYKELHEQYIRIYADFENSKKRIERDKNQALEYAYETIARDLLPVIDTLAKALESTRSTPNSEAIAQGLKLTLENLHKVLSKHGIECIDCQCEFDPNFHDAIMQVPAEDKTDGQIVQILQSGYKYKERVLRPAMVSIAKN